MKDFSRFGRRLPAAMLLAALAPNALGVALTWDPLNTTNGAAIDDGAGTWTTANVWNNGAGNQTWAAGDTATFTGTVGGTVAGNASTNGITVSGSANYAFSGAITGAGGLTMDNSGILTLNNAGTAYTGATTVNAGVLNLVNTTGMASTTTVNAGAILRTTNTANRAYGANFKLVFNGGAFEHNQNFYSTYAGLATVSAASTIKTFNSTGTSQMYIDGGIAGTPDLLIDNTGGGANAGVVFRNNVAANNYTGTITVNGGVIGYGQSSNALNDAHLTLQGAKLVMTNGVNGVSLSANTNGVIGTLAGDATSSIVSATNLSIGGRNENATFAGVYSSTGSLTKTGTGTQTLSGANTYTGATNIGNGILEVSGSLSGTAINFTGAVAGTQLNVTSTNGLTGATSLAVNNANINMVLSTANNYTGATTLSNGTLTLSGAGAVSGTAIAFTGAAAGTQLNVNSANGLTGTSSLNVNSTNGTAVLAAANNFTGTTTLNAGALQLQNAGSIASSTLALTGTTGVLQLRNDAATTFATGGITHSTANGVTTIDVNQATGAGSGQVLTLGGNIVASGGGTHTFNITGGNGYGLTIGNFTSAAAYHLTLNPNTANVSVGTVTGGGGGATILTLGGALATGTNSIGAISNPGSSWSITKNTASTWNMTGANTQITTGSVSAGTLNLTGSWNGSGAITVSGTGNFNAVNTNSLTGATALTVSAAGATATLSAANNHTGTTTLSAGTLQLQNAGSLASSALAWAGTTGVLQLRNDAATTFATGGITMSANSTTTLDVNQLTGAGSNQTLTLGGNLAQGVGSQTLNITGGNGYSLALGNFTGTANYNLTLNPNTANVSVGTVSRTTGASQNLTLGGSLASGTNTIGAVSSATGTWALIKSGASTWNMTGANTEIGNTTLSAGTLQIGGTGSFNGGAYAGTISNSATLQYSSGANQTFSGVISGTGALLKDTSASVLTLSGTNTYTGTTTVNAGTLRAGATASGRAFGTNSAVTLADAAGATLDLNNFNQTIGSLAGGGSSGGNVALGSATLTTGSLNTNTTYGGAIGGTGGLTKTGSGTQTLSGANTYTGTTTVSAGTLVLDMAAGADRIAGSSALTLSGGQLRFDNMGSANGQTFATTTLTASTSNVVTLGSGYTSGVLVDLGTMNGTGALDVSNLTMAPTWIRASGNASANMVLLGGVVTANGGQNLVGTDASGNLIVVDPVDFVRDANIGSFPAANVRLATPGASGFGLNGNNMVDLNTAGTTAWASLQNAYASGTSVINTGATQTLRIESGAIVNSAGSSLTVGNTVNASQLTAGIGANAAGTLTFNNDNAVLVNSIIANNGTGTVGVVKTGTGTTALANANTYTGATTISGGTLQIGAGGTTGSLASTADIADDATLAFNRSNALAFANNITGSGGVTQMGTGTTTLTGNSGYTGTTRIQAGTLALGSANAIGTTGNITFAGTATTGILQYSAANTTDYSGRIKNSTGSVNLNTNGQNVAISGPIDGTNTGGLAKLGAGTLTLNAASAYAGTTTMTGGTLLLAGGNNTLPTGTTVNFNGTSTLDMGATSQSVAGLTTGGSGITGTVTGAGSLTVTGNLTANFSTNATLDLSNVGSFAYTNAAGAIAIGNNNTVRLSQATNAVTAASLTLSGGGDLALGGANTLNVSTLNVDNGTLTYQAGLPGTPATVIRGTAGGSSRANMVVGNSGNTTGIANFSGGTLDAMLGTLNIGYQGSSGTANGTFTMTAGTLDATTVQVGQKISGSGGVTKTGNGTLNLNGGSAKIQTLTSGTKADPYGAMTSTVNINGGAVLSAQTMQRGGGNSGASRNIFFNDGTIQNYDAATNLTASGVNITLANTGTHTLNVTAGRTATFGAAFVGAGGTLDKTGTGTVILNATNTYTGNTAIHAGTFRIAGGGSLGSGAYAGNIANDGVLQYASSAAQTLSGTISGTGSLLKDTSATGVLTLTGANTYTGGTSVLRGVLAADSIGDGSAPSAIGQSTNVASNLVINGGTLRYIGAGGTTNRNFSLGTTAGSALDASGSGAVTFGGSMGFNSQLGARTLTLTGTSTADNTLATVIANDGSNNRTSIGKTGTGTWVMAGANTYTGTTNVSGGTLKAGIATNAFGVNSAVTLSNLSGVTLDLNNFNNSIGSLNGGGTTGGNVNLGSGILTTGSLNTNSTYAGAIGGTGGLTKVGTGVLALSGANSSYTGPTTIDRGMVSVATIGSTTTNGGIGRGDIVFGTDGVGTGTLRYTGTSAGSDKAVTLNATGTINVSTAATNLTMSGAFTGTGGLTKTGAGTLTLAAAGAAGYTGTTTVNGGVLAVNYAGGAPGDILPNGTLNMQSGTLRIIGGGAGNPANTQNFATVNASGTTTLNLQQNGATDTNVHITNLVRSGKGRLNYSGLTLDAAGQPTVGSRVYVDQINGVSTTPLAGNKIGNWSMVNGQGWAAIDNDSTAGGLGQNYIAMAGFYDIFTSSAGGKTRTIPAANDGVAPNYRDIRILDNGNPAGSGGTYTGVVLGADNVVIDSLFMSANGAVDVTGEATAYTGTAEIVEMRNGATSAQQTMVLGTDASVGGAIAIAQNAKGLTIGRSVGDGFLTGTGAGDSSITFINNEATTATSLLTVNSVIQNNGANILSVEVSGGEEGGTTVFAANNTYTGGTSITADATLRLTGVGTLGTGGVDIESGSTLDINKSANFTIGSPSATVTGEGTLLVRNTAAGVVTTLAGDMAAFSGTVRLQTGILDVDNTGGLGGGAGSTQGSSVTFTGGTLRFTATGAAADYGNVSVVGSTQPMRFDTNGQTVTFAGSIDNTNTGIMNKLGAGTLILTGSNTFTSATTVAAGTLSVGADSTLNNGTYAGAIGLTLATSTLDMNTTGDQALSGVISGLGNFQHRGLGTTTLSGANTYTGTTLVQNGTVVAGVATVGGVTPTSGAFGRNSAMTLNTNGTVDLNGFNQTIGSLSDGGGADATGTLTNQGGAAATLIINGANVSPVSYAGLIGDGLSAVALTKAGAGEQILSGNNTHTGLNTLAGGTLTVDNETALGSGNITFSDLGGANTGGTLKFGGNSVAGDYSTQGIVNSNAVMRLDTNGNAISMTSAIDATNTAGLTKLGAGSLSLAGDNNYTGTTTVGQGALYVDGTHTAGAGNYVVSAGTTLGGGGTIITSGTVTLAATSRITGGTDTDIDHLTVQVPTLSLTGTYLANIDLNGETGNQADASLADLITVVGNVDFTNAKLDLSGTNVAAPAGSHYAIKLFEWTGSATGATADWNVANITGLQANQTVVRWGNAYYLVPEPASFALLGLGSLLLLRRPSRRRGRLGQSKAAAGE